ncbi:MAG: TSUP family transporter [Candidatus Lokiarchaeota archaeon]|nr:TSUP family transporter [Candidatus Harpocratesius repetitus]
MAITKYQGKRESKVNAQSEKTNMAQKESFEPTLDSKHMQFHLFHRFQKCFSKYSHAKLKQRFQARFQNQYFEKLKKQLGENDFKSLPESVVYSIIFIGVVVSGILGGSIGIGSGMNFTLLFILLLGMEHLRATGTGSFLMMILMALATLLFYPLVIISNIWQYLVIGISFSAIGTIIGAKFTIKLQKSMLSYLVSGTLLIIGIFALVQEVFFLK